MRGGAGLGGRFRPNEALAATASLIKAASRPMRLSRVALPPGARRVASSLRSRPKNLFTLGPLKRWSWKA
jgi:hypothetical protein